MKKFFIGVIILILVVTGIIFAFSDQKKPPTNKIEVAASFYPMADFISQVGKDKVTVTNLTPVGVEPHDFEPSPQDILTIRNADVFIYSGAGFEPWANKVIVDIKKATVVINAAEKILLLPDDPHYYLDPIIDKKIIAHIATKLSVADPKNKSFYLKNAANYISELDKLDMQYKKGLKNIKSKDIVVSHNAFAYLAKRYNLNQIAIAGTGEEEPSPLRLAAVASFVKKRQIRYIFIEKLANPRLSKTIAKETGAKTLVLDPVEGLTPAEQKKGKNFISLMKENLNNLKIALGAK